MPFTVKNANGLTDSVDDFINGALTIRQQQVGQPTAAKQLLF
jgi:hypothetical protein